MGYRSQVVLVLSKDLEVPPEVETALTEVFGNISSEYQGDRLFSSDYIKWYTDSDYPAIDAIQNFVNSNDTDTDSDKFWFCRIGEDAGDVEYAGSYSDNFFDTGVVHRIEWTAPTPLV